MLMVHLSKILGDPGLPKGLLDSILRGTHGSIKYSLIRVLSFNGQLRIGDHYLRSLSESYITI